MNKQVKIQIERADFAAMLLFQTGIEVSDYGTEIADADGRVIAFPLEIKAMNHIVLQLSPNVTLPKSVFDRVRCESSKIGKIKLLRQITCCGLKDAKDWVETNLPE